MKILWNLVDELSQNNMVVKEGSSREVPEGTTRLLRKGWAHNNPLACGLVSSDRWLYSVVRDVSEGMA